MNGIESKCFECACTDRNHIIIATYIEDDKDWPAEIYLGFKQFYADNQYSNNIFKRFKWRIKNIIKILFTGQLEIEDSWAPELKELRKFTNWLDLKILDMETNEKNKTIKD